MCESLLCYRDVYLPEGSLGGAFWVLVECPVESPFICQHVPQPHWKFRDPWSVPLHRVATGKPRAAQSFHHLLTLGNGSLHPPRIRLGSNRKQTLCSVVLPEALGPRPRLCQANPNVLLTLRGSYAFLRRSNEIRNPLFSTSFL